MFEHSLLLMTLSTLKETLDSIAAEGAELRQALMAAQAAGRDAPMDSIVDALSMFRDTMNDGHLKAAAMLEVLQARQLDCLDDGTTDDFPPPSKSRYSAQPSGKARPSPVLLLLCVCLLQPEHVVFMPIRSAVSKVRCSVQKDCARLFPRQQRHSSSTFESFPGPCSRREAQPKLSSASSTAEC